MNQINADLVKLRLILAPEFGKDETIGSPGVSATDEIAGIVPLGPRLVPEAFDRQPPLFPGNSAREPRRCGTKTFSGAGRKTAWGLVPYYS
jgi:hypothetical protein